jgi:CRISPR type I-E-associated protein CasB/Cse2
MSAVETQYPSKAPPDPSSAPGRSLSSRLAGVAAYLDRLQGMQQRGPLAELRRLQPMGECGETRPSDLPGETFWALVQRFDIPRGEEPFWLALLPVMVRHRHQRGTKPGRAMEAVGISKARFERWLRLPRESAWREAPRLLSKLKDHGLDWVEFGHALHRWNEEDRYRLARDFFLARERREHTHTEGAR